MEILKDCSIAGLSTHQLNFTHEAFAVKEINFCYSFSTYTNETIQKDPFFSLYFNKLMTPGLSTHFSVKGGCFGM